MYRWRDAARQTGLSATIKYKNVDKWSSWDKFIVVFETANSSEIEFSEYYRSRGIYAEQVKKWKAARMNANDGIKENNSKVSKELREERKIKKLAKELQRKEKAFAEAEALLALREKANVI